MIFAFITDLFLTLTQFVLGLDSWQQVASLVLVGAIPFINYLSSAAGKLHAANRHEAARTARARGWI